MYKGATTFMLTRLEIDNLTKEQKMEAYKKAIEIDHAIYCRASKFK